jgi:hypothetical protein
MMTDTNDIWDDDEDREQFVAKPPPLREGDIYRWNWLGTRDTWCCSPFAVVRNGRLLDMFWMFDPKDEMHSQYTKTLDPKDVKLTFLANVADIEPVSSYDFHNYRREDIVDLRHSNNSGAANIYRRKGSKPDPATIRVNLVARIAAAEREIESQKWRIECEQRLLAEHDAKHGIDR